MKLLNVDPREFSEIISKTRGKIIFTTSQGDRLVSGSLLSTLVGLPNLIAIAAEEHVEVVCEDPFDHIALEKYFEKYQD